MIDNKVNHEFVFHDFQQLNELRNMAKDSAGYDQALKGAIKQFEAIFWQMLLKSMRDASEPLKSDLFSSNQREMYESMHDEQLSLVMAGNKNSGLSDMLYQQLKPQGQPHAQSAPLKTAVQQTPPAREELKQTLHADKASTAEAQTTKQVSQEDLSSNKIFNFIHMLWDDAKRVAKKINLDPKVMIAQAALETGWGKSFEEAQLKNFNLFGIKADKAWQGAQLNKKTIEYTDGVLEKIQAPFRNYHSFGESMQDYVAFLSSRPHYQQALAKADDPEVYLQCLQQAGYATDPNYANKILKIMQSKPFQQAVTLLTERFGETK